jgi:hypothetical protein
MLFKTATNNHYKTTHDKSKQTRTKTDNISKNQYNRHEVSVGAAMLIVVESIS